MKLWIYYSNRITMCYIIAGKDGMYAIYGSTEKVNQRFKIACV